MVGALFLASLLPWGGGTLVDQPLFAFADCVATTISHRGTSSRYVAGLSELRKFMILKSPGLEDLENNNNNNNNNKQYRPTALC